AELDAYRRAYGLEHPPPAKHVGGRVARDGRVAAAATAPTAAERAGGTGEQRERRSRGQRTHRRGDLGWRPTMAERRHRADPERLLGAEPRRATPGRRRDWHAARAALEDLVGWGRRRDQRHPDRDRPGRVVGRDLGRQERDGR
ncbi:MAG TPA: hypothetical protein VFC13_18970, partial [Actinomycetes bacterium]|nr:hypothetical protein [Actinomycetes bacterium]